MAPRPPDPCSHPYTLPPETPRKGLPYGGRALPSPFPVEPCPLGVRQVRRLFGAAAAWDGVRCRAEICPHRWRAGPCSVWAEIPGSRLPGGLVCLASASSREWPPQEREAGRRWSGCGRHRRDGAWSAAGAAGGRGLLMIYRMSAHRSRCARTVAVRNLASLLRYGVVSARNN